MCTEWWNLTAPKIACVQWYQVFSKPIANTADATDDFTLDLTSIYTVKAYILDPNSASSVIYFPSQVVDFDSFSSNLVDLKGYFMACSSTVILLISSILLADSSYFFFISYSFSFKFNSSSLRSIYSLLSLSSSFSSWFYLIYKFCSNYFTFCS